MLGSSASEVAEGLVIVIVKTFEVFIIPLWFSVATRVKVYWPAMEESWVATLQFPGLTSSINVGSDA